MTPFCDMNAGDVFTCDAWGLELKAPKPCARTSGSQEACSVPLTCGGQEIKKTRDFVLPCLNAYNTKW